MNSCNELKEKMYTLLEKLHKYKTSPKDTKEIQFSRNSTKEQLEAIDRKKTLIQDYLTASLKWMDCKKASKINKK